MTTDIRSFLRIIRLVVNQSTVPVMEFHERVIFLSSAVLCKSMWCYYSLCKIHRDDTFYNLSTYVCDWSLGTHEFSAFNFILKIGCDRYNQKLAFHYGKRSSRHHLFRYLGRLHDPSLFLLWYTWMQYRDVNNQRKSKLLEIRLRLAS